MKRRFLKSMVKKINQPKKATKGITLISLVITIVVVIILAAVSISTLTGDSGLIKKANKAKEDTEIADEKEAIVLNIVREKEMGTKLYDRTSLSSINWHIVALNGTNYGTNWSYIKKGETIIGYGNAKYSWLINTQTGEAIRVEEDEVTELAYDTELAVTEGLIFNADPKSIESGDEEKFGENVGINGGIVFGKNYLYFDGVDDYMAMPATQTSTLKSGFTFEFYGIIHGPGTSYKSDGTIYNFGYSGLFGLWNGNENNQALLRFGLNYSDNKIIEIKYNAGNLNKSDISTKFSTDIAAPWNQYFKLSNYGKTITKDEEFYITITVDGEGLTQAVYLNGELLDSGELNKNYWNNFVTKDLPTLNTFCIGRCSMSDEGYWHYSEMTVYALRLYNRGMTAEEVEENYKTTILYHNISN